MFLYKKQTVIHQQEDSWGLHAVYEEFRFVYLINGTGGALLFYPLYLN